MVGFFKLLYKFSFTLTLINLNKVGVEQGNSYFQNSDYIKSNVENYLRRDPLARDFSYSWGCKLNLSYSRIFQVMVSYSSWSFDVLPI